MPLPAPLRQVLEQPAARLAAAVLGAQSDAAAVAGAISLAAELVGGWATDAAKPAPPEGKAGSKARR